MYVYRARCRNRLNLTIRARARSGASAPRWEWLAGVHPRATRGSSVVVSLSLGLGERCLSADRGEFPLLDPVIRPNEERLGNRQTERLGGLEVDGQLELGVLLDGKVPCSP